MDQKHLSLDHMYTNTSRGARSRRTTTTTSLSMHTRMYVCCQHVYKPTSDGGRETRVRAADFPMLCALLIFSVLYVLCAVASLCVVHIFSPSIFNIFMFCFSAMRPKLFSFPSHQLHNRRVSTHGSHTELFFYFGGSRCVLLLYSNSSRNFFFFVEHSHVCVRRMCDIWEKFYFRGFVHHRKQQKKLVVDTHRE